jgi:hypothetical protein
MSTLICEIPKNSKEIIQLNLKVYYGHKLADLRVYCKDEKGSMIATRKGISIPISLWPQFREALGQLEAAMIDQKWLDKEDLEIQG